MSEISEAQMSLLLDIEQRTPLELDADKRKLIEALITAGFVRPSAGGDERAPYALTEMAQRFLSGQKA